jgi:hypothetical protein
VDHVFALRRTAGHGDRDICRRGGGTALSCGLPEAIVKLPTSRVIFLDFDGVLAPIRQWDRYGDLDPMCIELLNQVVAQSGADVVVSSTWRHGRTVAELLAVVDA